MVAFVYKWTDDAGRTGKRHTAETKQKISDTKRKRLNNGLV